MRFKLIVVFVEDAKTEDVAKAAKAAGATGCTRIYSASGEGAEEAKTFLGLTLETQRDVLLLLVEEHRLGTSSRRSARPASSTRRRAPGSLFKSTWKTRSASPTRPN